MPTFEVERKSHFHVNKREVHLGNETYKPEVTIGGQKQDGPPNHFVNIILDYERRCREKKR